MKTINSKKLILAFVLILAMIVSSCKKDDKDELSRTELLARTWDVLNIDGEPVSTYSGCDAITLKFESDGDLMLTVKLDGSSLSLAYTWSWADNENTIVVDDGYDPWDWAVKKLTINEFWFYDTYDDALFKCSAY